MTRYTVPVGQMIDDGDDNWGMVIDPSWTDDEVIDRWAGDCDPPAAPIRRVRLHAHSARQIREQPQAYDLWWSQEGELASSILVAERES